MSRSPPMMVLWANSKIRLGDEHRIVGHELDETAEEVPVGEAVRGNVAEKADIGILVL